MISYYIILYCFVLFYFIFILYHIILYWYYIILILYYIDIILYWYYIISIHIILYHFIYCIYIYIICCVLDGWYTCLFDSCIWFFVVNLWSIFAMLGDGGLGTTVGLGYFLNAICKPTCSWVQQQNLVAGWPTPTVSGKSFKIPWFQSPPSRNFKGKECFAPKNHGFVLSNARFPRHFPVPSLHSEVPGKVPPNAGAKQQILRIHQDLRRDSTSEHGILVGIQPPKILLASL